MADDDVEVLDVEQLERLEEGDKSKRSRLALAVILLLLLLLCVITTVVDVYVTAPESSRVQSIIRNLECLQCHVELIPSFSKQAVHNPFEKKSCTTCHTPHGEIVRTKVTQGPIERWQRFRTLIEWLPLRIACQVGAGPAEKLSSQGGSSKVTDKKTKGKDSTLVLPESELCWMCHGNVGAERSMAYTHNPFINNRCTSCHDPHASDYGQLLVVDERDLCVTCHPIGREINRMQSHPPAANRYCTTCHHPHASEWKGILVERQRVLCFTCHPTVAQLDSKPVQHNPFQYDNCTGCHEPHGSDYRPLLIQNQPALCYTCHPTIKQDFLKPSHHPAGTVQLNCGDCHNPHAAQYSGLLDAQDNTFCYKCHSQAIKSSYQKSLHKGVLCIRCHTPHGSDYTPLLRRSNPNLCLECHPPAWFDESSKTTYRNNHPVRPSHYDVAAKKRLTCTSTCHNPHGSGYNYMLRNWLYPLDGGCLQCHRVVPGKRVGIDF